MFFYVLPIAAAENKYTLIRSFHDAFTSKYKRSSFMTYRDYRRADTNRDGRVSVHEHHKWVKGLKDQRRKMYVTRNLEIAKPKFGTKYIKNKVMAAPEALDVLKK